MRDVLPELLRWWRSGATVGVGTVVGTWRSAPRPAGAAMLVGPGGEAVGSVSGGCVEGAVYELAESVVGKPPRQRGCQRPAGTRQGEEGDALLTEMEAVGEHERRGRPEQVEGGEHQRLVERPPAQHRLVAQQAEDRHQHASIGNAAMRHVFRHDPDERDA